MLQDESYIIGNPNDEGDVEENLVANIGIVQVESLFDFFDKINNILADDSIVQRNPWLMSLLKKVGRRGALFNLWSN